MARSGCWYAIVLLACWLYLFKAERLVTQYLWHFCYFLKRVILCCINWLQQSRCSIAGGLFGWVILYSTSNLWSRVQIPWRLLDTLFILHLIAYSLASPPLLSAHLFTLHQCRTGDVKDPFIHLFQSFHPSIKRCRWHTYRKVGQYYISNWTECHQK